MEKKALRWPFEVRDYELDLHGVVNNANYLHYFEHARHQCLKSLGLDVVALFKQGYSFILLESRIVYKQSLRANDVFSVDAAIFKVSRLRYNVLQKIYKETQVMAESTNLITCIAIETNKPFFPKNVQMILDEAVVT